MNLESEKTFCVTNAPRNSTCTRFHLRRHCWSKLFEELDFFRWEISVSCFWHTCDTDTFRLFVSYL